MPCSKNLLNDAGIKGLIFDFDGTLFNKAFFGFFLIAAYPPDFFKILKERLVRKRLAGCDFETPEKYYNEFFSSLGKSCSLSSLQMQNWYTGVYMPRMVSILKKHFKPREGVKRLFAFLEASCNFKTAVYSDYPFLRERMEALGLKTGKNILLFSPDSFGAQKPAAGPFISIAKDFSIPPQEALVAGDRYKTDGLGALNAKMHFYHVRSNRRWKEFVNTILSSPLPAYTD